MGNFLDNSLNLSSEFLRSFVTFLSTNKTLPREQNPTDTWFFGVISVDAVGQISSRQEETSAQISSDNLYYNEQPTSPPALTCLSPNPQQKLFLFSWQFHNYHFNFLHSRIIIPHEPVRLQTINPAALVLCSLKVCFQYSPAARGRITGPTSRRDGTSDLTDDHERCRTIITLSRDVLHSFTAEYHRRTIRVRLNIRH